MYKILLYIVFFLFLSSCASHKCSSQDARTEQRIDTIYSSYSEEHKDSSILRINIKDTFIHNGRVIPYQLDFSDFLINKASKASDTIINHYIYEKTEVPTEVDNKQYNLLLYANLAVIILLLSVFFCRYGKLIFFNLKKLLSWINSAIFALLKR